MFSGNNQDATKAIAQKFFEIVDTLNVDVIRLQESRVSIGEAINKLEKEVERIGREQNNQALLQSDLLELKKKIGHLDWQMTECREGVENLKGKSKEFQQWIDKENERREERRDDARSIMNNVFTWAIIGILTFLSGAVFTTFWVRSHEQQQIEQHQ